MHMLIFPYLPVGRDGSLYFSALFKGWMWVYVGGRDEEERSDTLFFLSFSLSMWKYSSLSQSVCRLLEGHAQLSWRLKAVSTIKINEYKQFVSNKRLASGL